MIIEGVINSLYQANIVLKQFKGLRDNRRIINADPVPCIDRHHAIHKLDLEDLGVGTPDFND